ncbi:MAG: ABC transporter ATP-binding protein [Pseudomonadota bacterium]
MTPTLSLKELTKAYPGVVACEAISLDLMPGEIHAVLGENGAGKSTLMKMIYGLVQSDQGAMTLNGTAFAPASPKSARSSGISMVFQHFSLFEAMSVAENIALGLDKAMSIGDLVPLIRNVSEAYGLEIKPEQRIAALSAGARQRVEIIRCLLQSPNILILDEPTSVLAPQEVDRLFTILRQLRDEGKSILYISHKLEEIRTLCDRATILRGGKVVDRVTPKNQSAAALAEMMIGARHSSAKRGQAQYGKVLLKVQNLSYKPSDPSEIGLSNVSFSVRAGEILGVAGIAGNGQDMLFSALSGEVRSTSRSIMFNGDPIGQSGVRGRRKAGILAAAEERLGHAAVPDMSLTENAELTKNRSRGRGFLNWSMARGFAKEIIETFRVATPSERTAASALSGGNLQKFVIGRELQQNPTLFVVNQPTWGVDAAAAASIRSAILRLAASGNAVVAISQDLDELFEIADRIAVLAQGQISAPMDAAQATPAKIGILMAGQAA